MNGEAYFESRIAVWEHQRAFHSRICLSHFFVPLFTRVHRYLLKSKKWKDLDSLTLSAFLAMSWVPSHKTDEKPLMSHDTECEVSCLLACVC